MMFNSRSRYGVVSIFMHWLFVFLIPGLFFSGLWMADLDYYDSWYTKAPFWHKSIGVIFFILAIFRLLWRLLNISPAWDAGIGPLERSAARLVQWLFYGLMLLIPISGYLMATAKGHPVDVLGWFVVPVSIEVDNSKDLWSEIHEILAWMLVLLALLHAGAACKHHFINKDNTLRKMLGLARGDKNA